MLDLQPDKKTMTVSAIVPELPAAPPRIESDAAKPVGIYTGLWTVPLADARVLVYKPDGTIVVDVAMTVGVTHLGWGIGVALLVVALGLLALWGVVSARTDIPKGVNPLLQIISTERNYASLSQAQILLWTLVVGGSAVFVMSLSGSLIDITGGTLVLLGISGLATLSSKLKSAKDEANKPQTTATATPADPPAPKPADVKPTEVKPGDPVPSTAAPIVAAAGPAKPPLPAKLKPSWSDLVLNLELVDNKWVSTIDITRVQMLFFTLVTATFVLMTVVASYEIPAIPDGFLILMGISNGVYVGSKFAK